jgi:hypothetical protein
MLFRNPFSNRNCKVRLYIKDGPTIEGVLAGRNRTDFIIWAPRLVTGDDDAVEVSGHVEIERSQVLWKQVIA